MSADGFPAGKAADGLVYDRLENGGGEIFFGRAVIDQRLDIRFCKYTASGGDGVKRLIIPGIFIQAGSVCLEKGRHLVDERAGTSGTDAVHALLNISAFEVNDFSVFSS